MKARPNGELTRETIHDILEMKTGSKPTADDLKDGQVLIQVTAISLE